jgi:hypothetical protein
MEKVGQIYCLAGKKREFNALEEIFRLSFPYRSHIPTRFAP